jgi:hypothetical protein
MPAPPSRRRSVALLIALGVLLPPLLTACGGDAGAERSGPSAEPQHSDSAGPTGTRTSPADQMQEQAEQAEREARRDARRHPPLRHPVIGADISWPQCPKGMGIPERRSEGQPMPLPQARYVVVGLTNGPAFTPNPCLAGQLAWIRQRHLLASAYAVVSWPAPERPGGATHEGPYDGSTRAGRLRNAGYAQASYNIDTIRRQHFHTPSVWVDVEPYPAFPWSPDLRANAEVVRGAVRAYRDAGFRVGIYSTPSLWRAVVGGLRFGVPEWRAAGMTGLREALDRCSADWSIQGGTAVLAQWTDGRRDHNTTCPGTARGLGRWFHQY